MRKVMTALLSLSLVLLPVAAEEGDPEGNEETPAETKTTEEEYNEETAKEEEEAVQYAVDLQTEYAVLIDADSGKVLFEKHSEEQMDPASLTKLMTVYLALEQLSPSQQLTMSDSAFQSYDHNQGVLWIQQNETLSVEDCVYASMLASANDTTAMLAEGVSGTIPSFVEAMNRKCEELSLSNTRFDNPFGFYSEGNYSSCADLAVLVRAALRNESFGKVFGASAYTIPATNMNGQARVIAADCEYLRDGVYAYEEATGGKIGSTQMGGFALAASAKRGSTSLVAVVLAEETADAAYTDTHRMFEYGFESAQTITITPADYGSRVIEVMDGKRHVADVEFTSEATFSILLPRDIDASSLETEIVVHNEDSSDPEKITAEVVFRLDGKEIGSEQMNRRIIREPEAEPVSRSEQAWKIFDYVSIAVLGGIVFFPLIIGFFRSLEPPK